MKQIINKVGIILLLVSVILLPVRLTVAQTGMTDDEIKSILQDRVDRAKQSVGIVVGLIDDKGTRIISYGKPNQASQQTVDGDSIFEIGSITKVFTATLLADMVNRGEVRLNDPISKYLPKLLKLPTRNGKQITLLHLTTHTSGLPRSAGQFRSERRPESLR